MTTLFAFLHHVAAFALVAALAVELVLLRLDLTHATARRLLVTDAILGASASILLAVGLSRVFLFEKGAAYYLSNHAFLTKLVLFIVIGVVSLVPTLEFLSWRRAVNAGQIPVVAEAKIRKVRMIVHIELAAVVVILLCAAVMARGA